MEVKVDEQMALDHPRRFSADPAAAEARVDREAAGLGDAVALVGTVERDAAGSFSVHLDHEPAESVRLAVGTPDLANHVVTGFAHMAAEKRPRVLIRDQLEQKVGVVGTRAAKLDATHASDANRRRSRDGANTPVPSATPPRINARPPNAVTPKRSPRKTAP